MSDVLDVLSSLANVAIAATAIWAVVFAWRQIALSREVSIREAYEHYHEVLLQYPQFTTGDVRFESLTDEEFGQYETFVLYTLMIGERVFILFPNNEGWHNSMGRHSPSQKIHRVSPFQGPPGESGLDDDAVHRGSAG